jgi:hypothetical protein
MMTAAIVVAVNHRGDYWQSQTSSYALVSTDMKTAHITTWFWNMETVCKQCGA